jgi:hypothetical protein
MQLQTPAFSSSYSPNFVHLIPWSECVHDSQGHRTAKCIHCIDIKVGHPPTLSDGHSHRSLFAEIKLDLIPSAQCGGVQDCDGTEAKPTCGGCPQGYCHCPGCQIRGCTPYYCTYTGNSRKLCAYSTNNNPNDPCYTCETDYNVGCTPVGP